jgi:predicted dehydrogenase
MTLRIGTLGAARITSGALLDPARRHPEVEVVAVAARGLDRARGFAAEHGIPRVHPSYDALLADPDIDAVYNPLPNGLHATWTLAALAAGKHVLCEKPFAANAEEAQVVAEAARRSGLVVMEAMHYRYHALTQRTLDLLAQGVVGEQQRIEATFEEALPPTDELRWGPELAGGAMMDLGCYTVHLVRTLAGAEPTVDHAVARVDRAGIDSALTAELSFADGRTGSVTASMVAGGSTQTARVVGSDGVLEVSNPFGPQAGHELAVVTSGGRQAETVPTEPTSYAAQLAAFVDAVLRQQPFPTNPDDSVATMRVVDACYRAAGLAPRRPTLPGTAGAG